MSALELGLRLSQTSYYLLAACCLNKIIFICYGVYLDLVLTRAYIEVLRTGEAIQLCNWSVLDNSCNSLHHNTHLSLIRNNKQIGRLWVPRGYQWSFNSVQKNSFLLLPHNQGWMPSSLTVTTPWGAYHKATLSWGGRLFWKRGIIKTYPKTASYLSIPQEYQPILDEHLNKEQS